MRARPWGWRPSCGAMNEIADRTTKPARMPATVVAAVPNATRLTRAASAARWQSVDHTKAATAASAAAATSECSFAVKTRKPVHQISAARVTLRTILPRLVSQGWSGRAPDPAGAALPSCSRRTSGGSWWVYSVVADMISEPSWSWL